MNTTENNQIKTGFAALRAYWKKDLKAGFLVFLIALPLCLGIAKASGFPPAMGVLTAMIGGLFSSFFPVSALAIKGPAAGLITIAAAAVMEFNEMGANGWQVACAIIVVMAVLQMLFGFLKFGALSNFFPHSAVHGMLAAIGIIIIAKQIPVLLGDEPELYKGESPLELIADIPSFIEHAHWHIAIVGLIGLALLFLLPKIKIKLFQAIPAPLVVLVVAVPLAIIYHFNTTEPPYSLVQIGDFWGNVNINADFSYMGTFAFWKYVVMFLFVSTLESLLTVKAIDNLDPHKRTSDYDGDLKGQGAGNVIAGLLGGLPMISEVVRSSANIGYGAVSKWSNFFHGALLLIAMIFMIPLIEMIPNAALAAMLIYAGYRLAAPKEFMHVLHVGKGQFIVFLVTIVITLVEDLLLGIAAGILVKFILHIINGPGINTLFKRNYDLQEEGDDIQIRIKDSAVFLNLIQYKKMFDEIANRGSMNITIDFSDAELIDHSFMSFIKQWEKNHEVYGSDKIKVIGLEGHRLLSDHDLAARVGKIENS